MSDPPLSRLQIHEIPPEGLRLRGQTEAEDLDGLGGDDRIAVSGPVQYDLRVTFVSGGVLVRGELRTALDCACDRCLRVFPMSLAVEEACHLYESVAEGTLDLTPELREDILLAFPQRLLCQDDCRGLCPTCGEPVGSGACSCESPETSAGPWSALDGFRAHGAADDGWDAPADAGGAVCRRG